ncbi:MAG: hypothetical protein M3N24_04800 [Actinomycetota bacterium]|nr:hypothetical protein [Actinomycetota bacterium]
MEAHQARRSAYKMRARAAFSTLLSSPATPAVAVGSVAAVVLARMRLASSPIASPDAWAYSAWGQAIARGERPPYELSATTPKPLATILGAMAAPLTAPKGVAVVVALALATLIGSLFFIGFREAGAIGAVVPIVALFAATEIGTSFRSAHIDIVVAALVVLGVALKRFGRVVPWGLAALLRPEAWILTAFGGFLAINGNWRRKALLGVGIGLVPVILWAAFDFLTAGDPLATTHWRQNRRALLHAFRTPAEGQLPGFVAAWLGEDVTRIIVVLLGLLGLSAVIYKARTGARLEKSVPLIVGLVWVSALTVERFLGQSRFQPRYVLPSMAMFALGCGFLGVLVTRNLRGPVSRAAAAAVGVAVVALFASNVYLSYTSPGTPYRVLAEGLDEALTCGRVVMMGDEGTPSRITKLIAASREPASKFTFILSAEGTRPSEIDGRVAAVLRSPEASMALPEWKRRVRTAYGVLAIAPSCAQR